MEEFAGPQANDLDELARLLQGCERCPLHREATQAVPGAGPMDAPLMLVGEQPGDREDVEGAPFVGPAGQVLDQALEEVGIDRGACYVTNAVKHFKFQWRGKRRIHQSPATGEITQCRWWLRQEIDLVRPKVVVALGASAARAVLERPATISKLRGTGMELPSGATGFVTVHPSYLLRLPDAEAKAREYEAFKRDLAQAAEAA